MYVAEPPPASPGRAMELTEQGMPWRVGRSIGRTVYVMTGPEASKGDLLIGTMDSPYLATLVVEAVNAYRGLR